MNNSCLKLLEFDKIMQLVASFASSQSTKEEILRSKPTFNYSEVVYNQNLTSEASLIMEKYMASPIVAFDNIDEIVQKAKIDAILQPTELLKVARMLKSARIAKSTILGCGDDVEILKGIVYALLIDEALEKDISIAIVGENEISDNASDKLRDIRRKIAQLNVKLKEKLSSYTRKSEVSSYLQDNLVTIRNNRFVLPVKSAFKNLVPGLVHDQSATGSTTFIEPFVIVELNNELRSMQAEESAEIERILIEFSKRVNSNSEMLVLCQKTCIMLDIVFSKYSFSVKNKCSVPILNKKGIVKLSKARHPLIDKNKVVPIDVEIGSSFDVLLITGPNTGGKTVSLKTIGLFCLMTYYGLWLPCEDAQINVYDNIFCDIGDEQSIHNELSTFSSHMVKIVNIVNSLNCNSLVLLDELGGGTDPVEGSALAIAIIDYIKRTGAKAVITTHYNELKEYGLVEDRVENACMQFDLSSFAPTFKLILGMPGTSNALNIAKRLGLKSDIIERATEYIEPEKQEFENLLKNAENLKNEALKRLAEIEQEKAEVDQQRTKLISDAKRLENAMEKIKSNATAETRRLVSSSMTKADEIIDKMKELLARADEGALLEAKKLRKQLENIDDEINRESDFVQYEKMNRNQIVPQTECVVISLNARGVIKSNVDKKGMVLVSMGAISTKVNADDIGIVPPELKKEKKSSSGFRSIKKVEQRPTQSVTFLTEIKVLGYTVDEAIAEIEPYLLNMYESEGEKTIKIVHGKGTMALARGLHRYFKDSPIVAEFRYGRYGEGDNGVTFVTVK